MNPTSKIPGSKSDPAVLLRGGTPSPAPPPASASPSAMMTTPQPTEPNVSQKLTAPSPAQLMSNPAVRQTAHDSILGKVFRAIADPESVSYTVDPATGKTIATRTREKPGQIFRNIVAGALVGGLAGSRAPANSGFAGGLAAGGAAEMEQQQRNDLLKRGLAEESFKTQKEAQQARDQHAEVLAKITSLNLANLRSDQNADLHSQEFLDESNARNAAIQINLAKAGAVPAQLSFGGENLNGTEGNGKTLFAALKADPKLALAPPGSVRVWTHRIDYDGLHFSDDGRWVDKNGQPVDLSTRTTWSAFDIPSKQANQNIQVAGSTLKKLGFVGIDSKSDYSLKLSDWISLQSQAIRTKQAESEFGIREREINRRQQHSERVHSLELDISDLNKNLFTGPRDPKTGGYTINPDVAAKLGRKQAELDKLLGVQGAPAPPPPPPNSSANPNSHVFSKSAWLRANPNGDINAAVKAAQAQGYQVVN